MQIPGRKVVRRLLRPVRRTLAPGALVLGYHRVAVASWDPLKLSVPPERFRAQLEAILELRRIVPLQELVARQKEGDRLDGFAALTFDDGYRDFADTVLPILESLGVPATVFVVTGWVGRSFWWDEISALLAPGKTAPGTLEIHRRDTGKLRYAGLQEARRRAEAARDICGRLVCDSEADIDAVIAALRAWAGEEAAADAGAMSWGRLRELAGHPLADLGAHTVSHGCLAASEPEEQREEIERSKRDLETKANATVSAFSYPNGSYARATPALVRALGFECACTSREDTFNRGTDPYRIPRVWAPDAAPSDFRRWLRGWAGGAA